MTIEITLKDNHLTAPQIDSEKKKCHADISEGPTTISLAFPLNQFSKANIAEYFSKIRKSTTVFTSAAPLVKQTDGERKLPSTQELGGGAKKYLI